MITRATLLSGFAALALLVTGVAGTASAGELPHRHVFKPVVQFNNAPTVQSAKSFALAKRGGDAISSAANSNLQIQDNTKLGFGKPTLQVNRAPTYQSAKSAAVAIGGGAALSDASNSNTIIQSNAAFGGKTLQANKAPTFQSAKSAAVAIGGGPAVSSASNSNVVSQSNVR
jgi:hypothetical protein